MSESPVPVETSEPPATGPTTTAPNENSSSTNPPGSVNQESSETQRSLQQASLALEVALNRIVEVRRSLLQLSESLPGPDSLPRFNSPNYNDVRPGHDVLLLAGDRPAPEEEMSPWHMEYTPPPPLGPLRSEAAAANTTINTVPVRPDSLFMYSPVSLSELGTPRRPYRHLVMNPPHGPVDPAATTRGLRVAAREANANLRQQDSLTDYSALTDEYESLLGSMGLNPPNLTLPLNSRLQLYRDNPAVYGPRPRDTVIRDQRRPIPPPNAPLLATASWRAPDLRRWRLRYNLPTLPPSLTQTPPQSFFDRLVQEQAGDPVVNPAANPGAIPAGNPLPPPTAPPDPRTNIPTPPSEGQPQPHPYIPFEDTHIAQHYRLMQERIQERMARVENIANSVNIDWSEDDFLSWLFPGQRERPVFPPDSLASTEQLLQRRQQQLEALRDNHEAFRNLRQNMDRIQVTRTTETQLSLSPPDRAIRRRGWARLDADGNEIPHDEELELERSRTEYRLRALQHARRQNFEQSGLPGLGGIYHDHNGHRAFYGSVLDSTLIVQDGQGTGAAAATAAGMGYYDRPLGGRSTGATFMDETPIHIDPLPMPLASMVVENPKQDASALIDIIVPNNAGLAGR